ncbi:hypothetical protein V7Y60_25150 [Priestia megaterium]|uniref:hypothetical protein n=1 Tax=Priestia megaterium TaxID=1404 RepID=UPI002FFEC715
MKINKDLDVKIQEFPEDLSYLARLLLNEIELGKRSNSQIEDIIREEIRELVLEEIDK